MAQPLSITALVDLFFREEFTVAAGQALFGPPRRTDEKARKIVLAPRPGSNIASAALETAGPGPDGSPLLEGLVLGFRALVTVDFGELARRLGPEEMLPRMTPDSDQPFRFDVERGRLEGYLLLMVPTPVGAGRRQVVSLILRRWEVREEPPSEAALAEPASSGDAGAGPRAR